MGEILVLVEGETDKGVITAIKEKLGISMEVRLMRGNRLKKIKGWIRTHRCKKYIVIKDLERLSEETIRSKFNRILKSLDAHLRDKVKLVIVKPMIEAWFLADLKAIENVYDCILVERIENPEEIADPIEKLNELLRKCHKKYVKGQVIAKNIVENMNIGRAVKKATSLRDFIKTINDP